MSLPSSFLTRDRCYDVLRGLCILGILLANIVAFSSPVIGPEVGMPLALTNGEEWLEVFRQWLVAGKFRGMLSILFGVGMGLLYAKVLAKTPEGSRPDWPGSYLKRTLLLAGIGIVHGLLIWFGDILFVYALVALVAMCFVGMNTKTLWIVVWVLAGLSLLMGIGMTLIMAAMGSMGGEEMLPKDFMVWVTPERETWVYAEGGYGMQFLYRAGMFLMMAMNAPFIGINLLALFLFGVILQREGVLTSPSSHPGFLKACFWWGIVGLVLNATPVIAKALGFEGDLGNFIEIGASMFLAGPLIVILAWVYEKSSRWALWVGPEKVGRIALTSYLSQSVICTVLFYSWGFGLFGQLDMFEMLVVVAGVWVWNLVFAWAWLRRFDIGPVEWVWRSLLAGRKLPWRRVAAPPVLG